MDEDGVYGEIVNPTWMLYAMRARGDRSTLLVCLSYWRRTSQPGSTDTTGTGLTLARLPQLGGHEDANRLIFLN